MNLKPPARGICAATVLGCCVIVLSGCTGTTSPGQPSPTGTSPLRAAPDIVSPPHADGSQGTFEPTPEPTRPLPNCRSRGSEPHPEPSEGNAILRLLCVQADGGTDPASLARSLESNDRASRLQQVVSQFLAGPSEAEQQAGWLSPFPVAPVARASESQEGGGWSLTSMVTASRSKRWTHSKKGWFFWPRLWRRTASGSRATWTSPTTECCFVTCLRIACSPEHALLNAAAGPARTARALGTTHHPTAADLVAMGHPVHPPCLATPTSSRDRLTDPVPRARPAH